MEGFHTPWWVGESGSPICQLRFFFILNKDLFLTIYFDETQWRFRDPFVWFCLALVSVSVSLSFSFYLVRQWSSKLYWNSQAMSICKAHVLVNVSPRFIPLPKSNDQYWRKTRERDSHVWAPHLPCCSSHAVCDWALGAFWGVWGILRNYYPYFYSLTVGQ